MIDDVVHPRGDTFLPWTNGRLLATARGGSVFLTPIVNTTDSSIFAIQLSKFRWIVLHWQWHRIIVGFSFQQTDHILIDHGHLQLEIRD